MKRNTVYAVFALALTAALAGKVVAEGDIMVSCHEQFRASHASDSCDNVTATFIIPDKCHIYALCKLQVTGYNATEITARWSDIPNLNNCNGILRVGPCD